MAFKNTKSIRKNSGFTIVELLIVIVVIAILATISIVAYTGIQNRAKTSSGQSLASQVEKKAQAFYTINNRYPDNFAGFASVPEAALEGITSGQLLAATVTSSTHANGKAISYVPCGTAGSHTGATIAYWDFTGTPTAIPKVIGTGC